MYIALLETQRLKIVLSAKSYLLLPFSINEENINTLNVFISVDLRLEF